mmetsp:Transcript_45914/g.111225  ORF Transcript_45914/g.111225 Transcript_45914/m.111225 type:complete len:135 (-) Transcript_45914:339-743(-)
MSSFGDAAPGDSGEIIDRLSVFWLEEDISFTRYSSVAGGMDSGNDLIMRITDDIRHGFFVTTLLSLKRQIQGCGSPFFFSWRRQAIRRCCRLQERVNSELIISQVPVGSYSCTVEFRLGQSLVTFLEKEAMSVQ